MTRKLTVASVLASMMAVTLAASVVAPTGKLTFLIIASLCVLVTVIECGTHFALMGYAAASVICAVFVPFKLQTIAFIVFLGYYPIIKRYIENLHNSGLEWLAKILFFSAVLVIVYMVFRYALLPKIDLGVIFQFVFDHIPAVVVALEAAFIAYDYLLGLFASYYTNVLQKKWKNRKV